MAELHAEAPPWADGDIPNTQLYVESELVVAGAISTLPPFDRFHPAWTLPIARQALYALGEWEPTDASDVHQEARQMLGAEAIDPSPAASPTEEAADGR